MINDFRRYSLAGSSTRFKGPKNKQLCTLNGKEVFNYSIDTFAKSKVIDNFIVVVNKELKTPVEDYLKKANLDAKIVMGGKTRQESVENALENAKLDDSDIVIINDGARPLIDEKIIKEVKKAAISYGSATTFIPEVDTIAVSNQKGLVTTFVDRSKVAKIQTPQAFKFGLLKKAHQESKDKNATDDCSLVLSIGGTVKLVEGSKKYTKITTIEDLNYLEGLIKNA